MDYTIQRENGATVSASYQEAEMIEAATLRWTGAADLPDGTEFDVLEFGGVKFKVYRSAAPAAVRVVYWAGTTQVEAEASSYAEATAIAAKNRNAHDPSFYAIATGKELFDDGRGLRGEDDEFYTA